MFNKIFQKKKSNRKMKEIIKKLPGKLRLPL